jgi:hypothetical protein
MTEAGDKINGLMGAGPNTPKERGMFGKESGSLRRRWDLLGAKLGL